MYIETKTVITTSEGTEFESVFDLEKHLLSEARKAVCDQMRKGASSSVGGSAALVDMTISATELLLKDVRGIKELIRTLSAYSVDTSRIDL